MKQSSRRIILLIVTVLAGTVLVFSDAPFFLIVTGTVAMGVLMLVILGNKKGSEDEPEELEQNKPGILKRIRFPSFSLKRKNSQELVKDGKFIDSMNDIFGKMKETVGIFKTVFSKPHNEPDKVKGIDTLLDKTVIEPVSITKDLDNPKFPEIMENGHEGSEENFTVEKSDFKSLDIDGEIDSDFAFEEDDFALSNEDLDSIIDDEPDSGVKLPKEPDSKANDQRSDIGFEDEFPKFPDEDTGEEKLPGFTDEDLEDLGSLSDLSDLSLDEENLESLENIGLDELDIEDKSVPDIPGGPDIPDNLSQSAPVSKETPPAKEDDISLDFSGGADSDIMDMLRSETTSSAPIQDQSLLREMKDVDIDIEDLVTELEEVRDKLANSVRPSDKK
jgi:hypothetical protein